MAAKTPELKTSKSPLKTTLKDIEKSPVASKTKTSVTAIDTNNGNGLAGKFRHFQNRARVSFGSIEAPPMPHLLDVQVCSFRKFLQLDVPPDKRENVGLEAILRSIFPISDFSNTSTLDYVHYTLGEPHYTETECRIRGVTYSRPLRIALRMVLWDKESSKENKKIREVKEQDVYLDDLPVMTDQGGFIINGTERVIVSQMHKSPGVFFTHDSTKTSATGKKFYTARIIPQRGSWVDFEFDSKDIFYARVDRKRKFPVTILLRALGYGEQELLNRFYSTEKIDTSQAVGKPPEKRKFFQEFNASTLLQQRILLDIKDPQSKKLLAPKGRRITNVLLRKLEQAGIKQIPTTAENVVGRYTDQEILAGNGEVIISANCQLTEEHLENILKEGIKQVSFLCTAENTIGDSFRETLASDGLSSPDEAKIELYRRMKPGDPPTLETARSLLNNLFFNPERYSLSRVGRLKLNKKLGIEESLDNTVLTEEDILKTVGYLLHLREGNGTVDDIDHLGNRRVRAVGELLENQFRVGLVRMERTIKERMSLQESESMMLHDIVNVKPVSAAVNEFFGSSQLSQFMDQTNPLAEITHKRRLSALGPGGLTREWAGFDVRDVHSSHYGRICPVETPEGPNIGLIASLAIYASVNEFGFIETPYHRVEKAKVLSDVALLSAVEEDQFKIAQANAVLDKNRKFANPLISARHKGDFEMIEAQEIDYMDVAPHQLVSTAASLIPFLEHDDANRALMGSNMQRQAVPLIDPKAPLVGTGMERKTVADSGACLVASRAGVVNRLDSARVIVQSDVNIGVDYDNTPNIDIYHLSKFRSSNQNICINQRPIVKVGQRVEVGDIIADGSSCDKGELALGQNLLVAFMPWNGYNFEDSILVSERVLHDDLFTSIHIEELEIVARETKLGQEDITRDIPNVGEEVLRNLDASGIVRIGTYVKQGDILVAKVTPKGETQPNPEEKLLRAIFGGKAGDVRDTSLRVAQGISGVVINVVVFNRKGLEKDDRSKQIAEETLEQFSKDYRDEVRIVRENLLQLALKLVGNKKLAFDVVRTGSREVLCKKGQKITAEVADSIPLQAWDEVHVSDANTDRKLRRIISAALTQVKLLEKVYHNRCDRLKEGDDLPPGVIRMVKVSLAVKRKLSEGDKMAGRHGNKGVVSRIEAIENMPYMAGGQAVDIVLNPLGVPSRMNVGQVLETHLGWAAHELGKQLNDMVKQHHPIAKLREYLNEVYKNEGVQEYFQSLNDEALLELVSDFQDGIHLATPVFDGAKESDILRLLKLAQLPSSGQITLYDGFTGEPFDQFVTVGKIYMMKLHHLVDEKIHARSIGPYSLVTQQPLGGKAQFGGQRFGEMEVWALQAYGSAFTLQEMLAVKSDDIIGRNSIYESIVKGNYAMETSVPESFKVLTNELKSLCLSVDLL